MPSSPNRPPQAVDDPNTQHRLLTHEIRVTEADLALAQRRRRWSNITLVFGAMLASSAL